MRRVLFALLPLTLLLAACQTNVAIGDTCTPGGDPTATDGTYVMVCTDGQWTPVLTADEFVRKSRGEDLTIAPLPTVPPLPAPEGPSTTVPVTSPPVTSPPVTSPPVTSPPTTVTTPPIPTGSFATIAGGRYYSCALTPTGGVKCWGNNDEGELGNGSQVSSRLAVDVTGLTSGVVSVVVGDIHACALTTAGGVKCWGATLGQSVSNEEDYGTAFSAVPVDVPGLTSGVASISSGETQACAVTTGGAVKCWGRNEFGQLGNGTVSDSYTPVAVSGLTSGIASVRAGGYHSCALSTTGAAKCWGQGQFGQLGNGTTAASTVPVDVVGLSGPVAQVSLGLYTSCAITVVGAVACWGYNEVGGVGDGTVINRLVPTPVIGLGSGVSAVASGQFHTCALLSSGGVRCWGNSFRGELGDGNNTASSVPVTVVGISTATSIGAGMVHSCAVLAGGDAKCWGFNYGGQLGDGTTVDHPTPVAVLTPL